MQDSLNSCLVALDMVISIPFKARKITMELAILDIIALHVFIAHKSHFYYITALLKAVLLLQLVQNISCRIFFHLEERWLLAFIVSNIKDQGAH